MTPELADLIKLIGYIVAGRLIVTRASLTTLSGSSGCSGVSVFVVGRHKRLICFELTELEHLKNSCAGELRGRADRSPLK